MSKVLSEVRRKARQQTEFNDESLTLQSERDRADIRQIMRKYEQFGIVDHMRQVELDFRDITEFTDWADGVRELRQAELRFMGLPSKLREVFDHDLATYMDAAEHPEKLEALRPQLEELGVLEPIAAPAAPQAPPAPVTAPAQPAAPPAGGAEPTSP